MNDRIKQLAIEAGYLPDNFGIGHWDMPECKRFAELIVLECVTIIDSIPTTPQGAWSDGYYEGCRDSAKMIKEHFGVEE